MRKRCRSRNQDRGHPLLTQRRSTSPRPAGATGVPASPAQAGRPGQGAAERSPGQGHPGALHVHSANLVCLCSQATTSARPLPRLQLPPTLRDRASQPCPPLSPVRPGRALHPGPREGFCTPWTTCAEQREPSPPKDTPKFLIECFEILYWSPEALSSQRARFYKLEEKRKEKLFCSLPPPPTPHDQSGARGPRSSSRELAVSAQSGHVGP